MPIMTSLSTRFFGQPRLTKPTFLGGAGAVEIVASPSASVTDGFKIGMESKYSSIAGRGTWRQRCGARPHPTTQYVGRREMVNGVLPYAELKKSQPGLIAEERCLRSGFC